MTTPPAAGRARALLLATAPHALFGAMLLAIFPAAIIARGLIDPGGDDAAMYLPYLNYSARAFFTGELLWTPDNFLGQPLLQQPEFAVYYPLRLFMPLLSPPAAYTAYLLLHFFLAQVTAYALLRGYGAGRTAAALAGVAYAFSGFMRGHQMGVSYVAAAAWSPLFLLFVHRFARAGRGRDALGAALCFGVHALTGAFQLMVYLAAATTILAAVVSLIERHPRYLAAALLVMVPGGLVGALQALPSLDLTRTLALTDRTDFTINTHFSWHPLLFQATYVPGTFDDGEMYSHNGAVVMVLALLGAGVALVRRRAHPLLAGYAAVLLVGFLLAVGRHIHPLAWALHQLPLVKVFRHPVRHLYEVGLAAAVLAGLALDRFVVRRERLPGGWLPWLAGLATLLAAGVALPIAIALRADIQADVRDYLRGLSPLEILFPALVAAGATLLTGLPRRRAAAAAGLALLLLAAGERTWVARARPYSVIRDREAELDRARALVGPPRGGFRRIITILQDDARGLDTMWGNLPLLIPGLQRLTGYATTAPRDLVTLLGLLEQGEAEPPAPLIWSRLPSILGVTHIVMPRAICDPLHASLDPAALATGRCSAGAGDGPVPVDGRVGCLLRLREAAPHYHLRFRMRAPAGEELGLSFGTEFEVADFAATGRGGAGEQPAAIPVVPQMLAPSGRVMLLRPPGSRGTISITPPELVAGPAPGDPRAVPVMTIGPPAAEGLVAPGVWFERGRYWLDAGRRIYETPYFLPRRPLTVTLERAGRATADVRLIALGSDGEENTWVAQREMVLSRRQMAAAGRASISFDVAPDAEVLPIILDPASGAAAGARARVTIQSACAHNRYRELRPLWDGLWLYGNAGALPRVYAPTELIPEDDLLRIRARLRDDPRFRPGRTVFVPRRARLPPRVAPARIIGAAWTAGEVWVDVAVRGADPGFVVVNDRIDPHWRATVDGRAVPLYRVNGVVRGVLVPPGRHRIHLWFATPASVPLGLAAGVAGILLALLGLPRLLRRL